jgi:hypothetical protein
MSGKTATVRVRLVVEVTAHGAWGEDCTMGQIRKQGVEQATNSITTALSDYNDRRPSPRFRIVSVDACDMVIPLEAK